MNLLTRTLIVNASLSAATGVVLVVGAASLPDWLGIPTWISLVVGIGLVLFAVQVLRIARRPRRSQVMQVIGADVIWVVGAATVIVVFPGSMSTAGLWALGVVTAAVALFAVFQTVGLGRSDDSMSVVALERSLSVAAPISRVWEVVSAADEYHRHTDTLARTAIVSGEGEGAVRHCVDSAGREWYETCTTWKQGRAFSFEVDVSTYPLTYRALFRAFRGTWRVDPIDGGAVVTVRFDAMVRRIPGASVLAAKLTKRAESELESILESYRVAAEGVDGSDREDCCKEVGE